MNSHAVVSHFQVFPDASGAPAVIAYRGFVYACDHVGAPKLHAIQLPRTTRRERLIAQSVCEAAYRELLAANVDDTWVAANLAMYAETV